MENQTVENLARMAQAAASAGAVCSTGLPALDDALGGGLFPGLTLLVGKQNGGKTTLATQILAHVKATAVMGRGEAGPAEGDPRNIWSGFLSFDMAPHDAEAMALSCASRLLLGRDCMIPVKAIKSGNLNDAQAVALDEVKMALQGGGADWAGWFGGGTFGGRRASFGTLESRLGGAKNTPSKRGPERWEWGYLSVEPEQWRLHERWRDLSETVEHLRAELAEAEDAEAGKLAEVRASLGDGWRAADGSISRASRSSAEVAAELDEARREAERVAAQIRKPKWVVHDADSMQAAEDAAKACEVFEPLYWSSEWGERPREFVVFDPYPSRRHELASRYIHGALAIVDYLALLGRAMGFEGDQVRATNEAALACRDFCKDESGEKRAVLAIAQYRGGGDAKPLEYDSILGGSEVVNASDAIVVITDDAGTPPRVCEGFTLLPKVATVTKCRHGEAGRSVPLWFDGAHARYIERR